MDLDSIREFFMDLCNQRCFHWAAKLMNETAYETETNTKTEGLVMGDLLLEKKSGESIHYQPWRRDKQNGKQTDREKYIE